MRSRCKHCGVHTIIALGKNGTVEVNAAPSRGITLDPATEPMVARERNIYTKHSETCGKQ